MGVAILSSFRSKDPNSGVGACIVNKKNRIVGVGYNGMPRGCSDMEFPWARDGATLEQKYLYVVHAELNAILNSTQSLKNCTIYTALFPCNECCKAIIQSGIKQIVYLSDKYEKTDSVISSKRMFDSASVAYRQIKPNQKEIKLSFS